MSTSPVEIDTVMDDNINNADKITEELLENIRQAEEQKLKGDERAEEALFYLREALRHRTG